MRIGEAKTEDELVAALDEAKNRRLELRRGRETTWWNNLALVAGDHYARWNPTLSTFEDRDPNWQSDNIGKKPRMVVNHALTVARTELSKLTKTRPIMDVMANSDEQSDISAAKVGRSALEYAEWKFRLDRLRKQAFWWMIQTGLGAIFVGWDPLNEEAGTVEFVIDPTTGEPTFNPSRLNELQTMVEEGQIEADEVKRESFPLGEVAYKIYSPFQLLPDEVATDFDEINDLITVEVQDIDVVKGMYGKRADALSIDSQLHLGALDQRMLTVSGVGGSAVTSSNDNTVENGTAIYTFYLLPNVYRGNKFLRDGVCLRWGDTRKVLDFQKRFPYNDNRIPFVFYQHVMTSGTIWPDSIITHIRGPNLEIDKTISQLIENKDYMSNPMWLVATQHRIKGEVKNIAGSIVRYRHVPNVPAPQPVAGMQMPQQVENLLVGLRDQILDISGQSEVARGRVPSGVRSGVAVAYLQEEDDTKIAPTVDNIEQATALMGSLTLERFSQFYNFDRILRFYRRDGIFDVLKFKGSDLKNNTDVVCQAGSAMPKSKAARQQFVLELASLGIEKDPRKLNQMLELGYGEPDDTDKAIAQANRENNMMLHGVWRGQTTQEAITKDDFEKMSAAVPVKQWHNHEVHISRHTSQMMDEEFDHIMVTRPEVARLFDEHLNMHFQMLQQQQQQQQQALLAARGAPDGPPTPPGGSPAAAAMGTNMTQTEVPDVIGNGTVRATARQIRPQ